MVNLRIFANKNLSTQNFVSTINHESKIMMNRVSQILTTLATISITVLPATAMEAPLAKLVASNNHASDATHQIEQATQTNYCVYIAWADAWKCR